MNIRGNPRRSLIWPCAYLLVLTLGCSAEDSGLADVQEGEHLPGGDTTNTLLLGINAFTMPASNITPEHEMLFHGGNSFFNQAWVQAPASTEARDGLGPLFNARSCAACHFKDGRGRPPLGDDESFLGILLRLSIPGEGEHGAPVAEPTYGGQLQPFSVLGVSAEGVPRVRYEEVPGAYADGETYVLQRPSYEIDDLAYGSMHDSILVSPRVAPAMTGLGLLGAITLERLEALEDPEDRDGDGISGRINQVWDVESSALAVGRFGWKAEQPSVRQQSAGAFLGDIGITTSLFPDQECTESQPDCANAITGGDPEISDDLLDRVSLYASLLAVPVRVRYDDEEVLRGKYLFSDAGCADCHTPSHVTGVVEHLPEVSEQRIFPYTDLLLHDMGEELSDDRPSFGAEGKEWRTPPLWGLRLYVEVNGHERLMHDGRARGVAEAILWHGGEGESSREAFRSMGAQDRAALVAFVESL